MTQQFFSDVDVVNVGQAKLMNSMDESSVVSSDDVGNRFELNLKKVCNKIPPAVI